MGPGTVSSSEIQIGRMWSDGRGQAGAIPTYSEQKPRLGHEGVLAPGTPGPPFSLAPDLENIWEGLATHCFSSPFLVSSGLPAQGFFLTKGSVLFGQEAWRAPRGWAGSRPV